MTDLFSFHGRTATKHCCQVNKRATQSNSSLANPINSQNVQIFHKPAGNDHQARKITKKRVSCHSVINETSNFRNTATTVSIDLMNSLWRADVSKFPKRGRRGGGRSLGSVRQFLNEKGAMHFNKISAQFRRRLYTIESLINLSIILYPGNRCD